MVSQNITIYGTNWCPDTTRARQCLNKHGIAYTWCDIEQNKEGCAFVEKVNQGRRTVPTIVFSDGTILIEPSNYELEKKMGLVK